MFIYPHSFCYAESALLSNKLSPYIIKYFPLDFVLFFFTFQLLHVFRQLTPFRVLSMVETLFVRCISFFESCGCASYIVLSFTPSHHLCFIYYISPEALVLHRALLFSSTVAKFFLFCIIFLIIVHHHGFVVGAYFRGDVFRTTVAQLYTVFIN